VQAPQRSRLTAGGPHSYQLRADSDVGGEVYERELLQRLPAHGVDVLGRRIAVHWVAAAFVAAPYVVDLVRRRRVDLLRGPSVRNAGPALLLGRALARSRVPIVLHHHHFYPRWARVEAAILRRADAVITVSEHSRAELAAAGVRADRIHVALEGVARPPATEGWADAWSSPGLRLLHVGRLEPRKRPWVALDALAALRGAGIEASLVLAGDGPLSDELRVRAVQRGVSGAVRLLGRVSEHDKWRLYDSAEVLLFASTLEGFGLVVAEAQSRGLPVIAAAGTATAEALDPGRSGLLSEPTGEAFAAAAHELADEARRAEMSTHARQFAARFDWDRCAAEVAAVYRDILRR
jgi:glycosyltransferase involved in cell wall biosynthesis